MVCLFENRFVPFGAIAIAKRPAGRRGTTGFVISSAADPTRQFTRARTTPAGGGTASRAGTRRGTCGSAAT